MIVTVPLRAPATLVSTATDMLPEPVLLVPARRPLIVPVPAALPAFALKLAFRSSLNAPAAAVLAIVSTWLPLPPTRWLARTTGLGAALPAAAL